VATMGAKPKKMNQEDKAKLSKVPVPVRVISDEQTQLLKIAQSMPKVKCKISL